MIFNKSITMLLILLFALILALSIYLKSMSDRNFIKSYDIVGISIAGDVSASNEVFVNIRKKDGTPSVACHPSFFKKTLIAMIINGASHQRIGKTQTGHHAVIKHSKTDFFLENYVIFTRNRIIFVRENEIDDGSFRYSMNAEAFQELIRVGGEECLQENYLIVNVM